MSLLSQFVVRRSTDRTSPPGITLPMVPTPPDQFGEPQTTWASRDQLIDDARFVARILLVDGVASELELARLEAGLDERVEVWTPAIRTGSRFEFVALLVGFDDAIGEVAVSFGDWSVRGQTVLVEWSATGRFSAPLFLEDDWLVEPTGGVIEVAGAFGATFANRRAVGVRCYYDQLSLLVQMGVVPGASADRRTTTN